MSAGILKPASRPPGASFRPSRAIARYGGRRPADDGFFADPDYSEFDCMDEPPVVEECPSAASCFADVYNALVYSR